ncbi:MAG TPA: ISKra4 family transposase [Ktedonobacteraceae bacterium]|nr:ISKra4 family transposase [Ktedonobacteraceae bacterium]
MYVTVSLRVELDTTANLTQMEQQIQETGRAAMQEALRQAIRQREEQQKTCPRCGGEQRHGEGTKQRVVLSCFGRVEVPLRRMRCEQCGQRYRPADPALAEIKGSKVTPQLRELAALVGCSWPYESAASVLKQLSGVHLSDERVRQLTNEQGSALADRQMNEAQEVLDKAVSMTHIRDERERRSARRAERSPEWLEVGLDGGWLPSREQKGGMEGKIGVIASQLDPVGKHGRHRLTKRRYVATFAGADDAGTLSYAAACELEATEAGQQVVLGDGAEWIKTQSQHHFPQAVKILDWPHLCRKIQAAIRALQPGKRASWRAWRKEQYEMLFPLLWDGKRVQALAYLWSLRPASGEAPRAFDEAVNYLQTQADWMGNYQAWREQGYPVGSGLVERAVAVVINMRMKRRGMRWKRSNATSVVALRVQRINTDWEPHAA